MHQPRIVVPIPTASDLEYNRQCWREYAAAITLAGGVAVEMSLHESVSINLALVRSCDGILLPGSPADVDPSGYGQSAIEACAPADPAREQVDRLLLEDAYASGRPLLAICFGCQMLNVWRGGTLVQDLGVLPVHHAAGRSVAVAHTALVESGSLLGRVLDPIEASQESNQAATGGLRLPINSSHHQAIAIPGSGLRVVARCPQDGVVEAVEAVDAAGFIMGLQWHPERSSLQSASSRSIFERFVGAAADRIQTQKRFSNAAPPVAEQVEKGVRDR